MPPRYWRASFSLNAPTIESEPWRYFYQRLRLLALRFFCHNKFACSFANDLLGASFKSALFAARLVTITATSCSDPRYVPLTSLVSATS